MSSNATPSTTEEPSLDRLRLDSSPPQPLHESPPGTILGEPFSRHAAPDPHAIWKISIPGTPYCAVLWSNMAARVGPFWNYHIALPEKPFEGLDITELQEKENVYLGYTFDGEREIEEDDPIGHCRGAVPAPSEFGRPDGGYPAARISLRGFIGRRRRR
uniref:Uncharacterized protein n=1 Tax=Mycena chlorophos TaxID=658473 RepID=A0ABQ0LA29_MYCCL|nr:predicted protein [Mycena chlorophos]